MMDLDTILRTAMRGIYIDRSMLLAAPMVMPALTAKPRARDDASPKLFDLKQAARKLGITNDQTRGLIQDGELPYINVGRGKKRPRLRFTEADLDELIERRRRKSEPCPSTNRESHRIGNTISKSKVIGFTAQRNARLEKRGTGSKP